MIKGSDGNDFLRAPLIHGLNILFIGFLHGYGLVATESVSAMFFTPDNVNSNAF